MAYKAICMRVVDSVSTVNPTAISLAERDIGIWPHSRTESAASERTDEVGIDRGSSDRSRTRLTTAIGLDGRPLCKELTYPVVYGHS